MKNFNLVDHVYKNWFIFLYWSPEEIIDYANENDLPLEIEPEQWWFCLNIWADCYIWIRDLKLWDLVHECIHATQYAMDYRWISTDIDNTEITAYHTQWLFEESSNFYLKCFKNKKL